MIETLKIQDLALVDSLSVEFAEGFNVLTGETGAGKSILLQALSLLLGDRASREMVRTGARGARVEGVFQLDARGSAEVAGILEEGGVAHEEPLIIVRTVSDDGKSRAFINGATVPVSLLAQVGAKLVEVSSQHQHQALLDEERHVEILDRALDEAGREALSRYREAYGEYLRKSEELKKLQKLEADSSGRRDFLAFQAEEIKSAGFSQGEDEALEAELSILANAEKLLELYNLADEILSTGEAPVSDGVSRAIKALEKAAPNDPEAAESLSLLGEAQALLDEAARMVAARARSVKADPARLEEAQERLALLRKLERKHGKGVLNLLEKLAEFERELWALDNREIALETASIERDKAAAALNGAAASLSEARKRAAGELSLAVGAELSALGFISSAFAVDIKPAEAGLCGADGVLFLFAPNTGEEPRRLARIASGGELSRVLLAVKNALRDGAVQSLVFDEVDAGIGGTVAEKVGERLRSLAGSCQVICVTHLPQIASMTKNHLLVEKKTREGRTTTTVSSLDGEARVRELARMLGSTDSRNAAFIHAAELAGRCEN